MCPTFSMSAVSRGDSYALESSAMIAAVMDRRVALGTRIRIVPYGKPKLGPARGLNRLGGPRTPQKDARRAWANGFHERSHRTLCGLDLEYEEAREVWSFLFSIHSSRN